MSQRPMEVGTTRGGEEREPRSLSAPVMRFELAAEAARLRAEQPFAEGNRNARTLVKVGAFRLVLVALRSGASFTESDQRGAVALQVLEGRVVLSVAEETVEVGQAEVAVVAPGHPWTAVAVAVEPWIPIKALTSSVCDDVRWFVTAAGVFKVQTTR